MSGSLCPLAGCFRKFIMVLGWRSTLSGALAKCGNHLYETASPNVAVTSAHAVSTCQRLQHRMPEQTYRFCLSPGVMAQDTVVPLPACIMGKAQDIVHISSTAGTFSCCLDTTLY